MTNRGLYRRPDPSQPAHVGHERLGHPHRTVGLLIVFKHGNERSTDREPRTV